MLQAQQKSHSKQTTVTFSDKENPIEFNGKGTPSILKSTTKARKTPGLKGMTLTFLPVDIDPCRYKEY